MYVDIQWQIFNTIVVQPFSFLVYESFVFMNKVIHCGPWTYFLICFVKKIVIHVLTFGLSKVAFHLILHYDFLRKKFNKTFLITVIITQHSLVLLMSINKLWNILEISNEIRCLLELMCAYSISNDKHTFCSHFWKQENVFLLTWTNTKTNLGFFSRDF